MCGHPRVEHRPLVMCTVPRCRCPGYVNDSEHPLRTTASESWSRGCSRRVERWRQRDGRIGVPWRPP